MPFNEDKALSDIYQSIGRLNMRQLIVLQMMLSEHIFNCVQYADIQKEKANAGREI